MKKLIVSLAILTAMTNTAMAQKKADNNSKAEKAEMIRSFTTTLEGKLVESGIEADNAKKFADCYAADMDKTFSSEELKTFMSLQEANSGKVEITEEMKHQAMQLRPKMAELGQSCNSLLGK